MDGYYWPPDGIYADYSGYYPPVYGGVRPWLHQTSETRAPTNTNVAVLGHPGGSPTSQASSVVSSEDESDVQVSSIQHNLPSMRLYFDPIIRF